MVAALNQWMVIYFSSQTAVEFITQGCFHIMLSLTERGQVLTRTELLDL